MIQKAAENVTENKTEKNYTYGSIVCNSIAKMKECKIRFISNFKNIPTKAAETYLMQSLRRLVGKLCLNNCYMSSFAEANWLL